MNVDQSEDKKLSLWDCHGIITAGMFSKSGVFRIQQQRDNFDSKQTLMTVFIHTRKLELSLQARTRNLECLGSNWHALQAWVWGLIALKLARKTCQLTSRFDPRHKQTDLRVSKYQNTSYHKNLTWFQMYNLMTKIRPKYTKKKSSFLGKIGMDKTDIWWNSLSNWPPVTVKS